MTRSWRRLFLGGTAGLCACLLGTALTMPAVPTFDLVRERYRSSDAVLLDQKGRVIYEWRVNPKLRQLEWISLDEVQPNFLKLLIHAEDRRFASHHGIDWRALSRAMTRTVLFANPQGASTLTMQTANLIAVDGGKRAHGIQRFWNKWQQVRQAIQIERRWSKAQIIEAYVNLAPFRGELYGIHAAARGLFHKMPHGLTMDEAAILVVLIRSPSSKAEMVAQRACRLLQENALPCGEDMTVAVYAALRNGPPIVKSMGPLTRIAPHFAHRFYSSNTTGDTNAGRRVFHSTLDLDLQSFARDSLHRQLVQVSDLNVSDGAILVLDNASGAVLSYVGSSGAMSAAAHVDGILGARQAGSILKPFLYGLALDRRLLTAQMALDDSPLALADARGVYHPQDYDRNYRGAVSVRTALASSLNVPAVRTLLMVGVPNFVSFLKSAGLTTLESQDYYGPSLALGAADVTLWDLSNAYRALATQGLWRPVHTQPAEAPGIAQSHRLMSSAAAFIVANILSDREARQPVFGLENSLATRFWSAVKTGTSKDMRDNWCVGFSTRYTVGVWVGNFSGQPMWNVSGITGAAPVWLEVMNKLHDGLPSEAPPEPQGLVERNGEWFLKGTEPHSEPVIATIQTRRFEPTSRIVYPVAAEMIALDPDIPDENQRIFFVADPPNHKASWHLNGKALGRGGSPLAWQPTPGKHLLQLLAPSGQELDQISFEVKGQYLSARRFH